MRSIAQFWRNLVGGDRSLGERLRLFARNYPRRFVPLPPRGCCGHGGEPGC